MPARILVDIDKLILKFIWKVTGPKVAKTLLKKEKKKVGAIIPPDNKGYSLPTVI